MFIYKNQIRIFYYTIIGFVIIAMSSMVFFHKMMSLRLTEDRRYVMQSAKNTRMGTISDVNGTVLGHGIAVGQESWNSDYSECMGNLIGPSLGLSRINAYYLRSYYAAILYGQKQEHLAFSDLISTSAARTGGNVQLTIDAVLQKYAYDVLAGEYPESAVVVLNYKTGEIKAAVSVPSFDLNDETVLNLSQETVSVKDGRISHYTYLDDNRAVSKAVHELYMPGSEIKTLLYTAALTYDPSLFDTVYTCSGSHTNKYGITVKCAGNVEHGTLKNMPSALSVSCNGYAEAIFEALTETEEGRKVLEETMKKFGFDTSLSYPGLVYSDGIFLGKDPNPANFQSSETTYEEALAKKRSMETYSAIGGGQCRTTVFGLAVACATFANRGTLVEPHMIKAYSIYSEGPLSPFEGGNDREICSPVIAEKILDMMGEVTAYGTGTKMALDGLRVCSKTGTAVHDDPSLETLWAAAVIDSADYPYVIVVMLDKTDVETQTSSEDAGGVVKKILKYLT